ncbi:hypothetical protein MUK42_06892 [Musa troglodytarum]|uniref:Uncharacterized protein n=1 Tax=Musa troglodytarum TaxID=320322 RepID=A0A9E7HD20_9LILI|nr:hypothetical protein MUK42_06892 [Musa troglodytarum]
MEAPEGVRRWRRNLQSSPLTVEGSDNGRKLRGPSDFSVDNKGRLGPLHLWRRQQQKASVVEAEATLGFLRVARAKVWLLSAQRPCSCECLGGASLKCVVWCTHEVKANDGEGPELLRSSSDNVTSGHAESLAVTLAEHRQHLVSIQGLISQLKEAIPAMQKSIADLTEEVENISSTTMDGFNARPTLNMQSQGTQDIVTDDVIKLNSRLSSLQLEKASTSPVLKLPHLISLAPNSSGKNTHTSKRTCITTQSIQESLPVGTSVESRFTNDCTGSAAKEDDNYNVQSIRRSVREAALSRPLRNSEVLKERSKDDGSEHFFIPLSTGVPQKEVDAVPIRRKQQLVLSPLENNNDNISNFFFSNSEGQLDSVQTLSINSYGFDGHTNQTGLIQPATVNSKRVYPDIDDALDQVFSPPLLMESSFFQDTYEDLLAPLSDTDAALMDF